MVLADWGLRFGGDEPATTSPMLLAVVVGRCPRKIPDDAAVSRQFGTARHARCHEKSSLTPGNRGAGDGRPVTACRQNRQRTEASWRRPCPSCHLDEPYDCKPMFHCRQNWSPRKHQFQEMQSTSSDNANDGSSSRATTRSISRRRSSPLACLSANQCR